MNGIPKRPTYRLTIYYYSKLVFNYLRAQSIAINMEDIVDDKMLVNYFISESTMHRNVNLVLFKD